MKVDIEESRKEKNMLCLFFKMNIKKDNRQSTNVEKELFIPM